jgi:hypothetical protein
MRRKHAGHLALCKGEGEGEGEGQEEGRPRDCQPLTSVLSPLQGERRNYAPAGNGKRQVVKRGSAAAGEFARLRA